MALQKISIAHISDLHRSQDNPVTNKALLASLMNDMDSYVETGIKRPDILVVSGDIAQGAKICEDFKAQYEEALEFLVDLAQHLFDGDRSKIILVPGNHDVDWSASKASMKQVPEDRFIDKDGSIKREFLDYVTPSGRNLYRWSWPQRSFYKVEDHTAYNQRFSHFSDMYTSFYEGKRAYSHKPDDQFDIFDYPEFGLTFVGLNSCFCNDHLNRSGSINSDGLANVGLNLRDYKKSGRFIFSVWHHNTRGGPHDNDYMEPSFLKPLISYGVKIGFHGHQHKQEILREESNILDQDKMILISAGSLCAGPMELPTGYNQQYNILEMERKNSNEIEFRLNSCTKTPESSFSNPVWCEGSFSSSYSPFIFNIGHKVSLQQILINAEKLIGEKKYQEASKILETEDIYDPFIRMFLLACYENLEDNLAILNRFIDPTNNNEAVLLMSAAIEEGDKKTISKILNIELIKSSDDPSIRHLRNQLEGKI